MTLIKTILACLLLLVGVSHANVIMYVEAAVSGGPDVAWVDNFLRADNTDLTANCNTEGPNDDCGWTELLLDASVAGQQLVIPETKGRIDADTDTNSAAHYSAAKYTGIVLTRFQGPSVRGNGAAGAGDCAYVFRFSSGNEFELRACNTGAECVTITTLTNAGGDFTDMANGDSIGLSVDAATGDGVEFTTWKFPAQSPPTSFAGWAGAAGVESNTVCTAGCDKGFDTAPSAALCNAEGKRVGMYNGNTEDGTWDDWVGGDI